MFYVSFMKTTKQKPIVDTWKIKRKKSKHITIEHHQVTLNRAREEETEEVQNSQKTINEMVINTYQSINMLNVNGLNLLTKK